MISLTTTLRVRYAETDQMRMAYYSRYLEYFEVARTALLQVAGVSYKSLEDDGYYLPVLEAHVFYLVSARYDDELAIETTFDYQGTPVIRIDYVAKRGDARIATGYTTHAFVKADTGKPCKPPQRFRDVFNK